MLPTLTKRHLSLDIPLKHPWLISSLQEDEERAVMKTTKKRRIMISDQISEASIWPIVVTYYGEGNK